MNELVTWQNNPLWFMEESSDVLEYSDKGLASQIFAMADNQIYEEQKDIVKGLLDATPAMAELLKGLKKTETLQLVFSDEVKQKLSDGTYKLMKKKDLNGIFKAVVVDQKGKTRAIADIKFDQINGAIDPTQVTLAMQGMAIQQQLREISEQLETMTEVMEDVLIGQHNDRIALYLCGESIYREALLVSDSEVKKNLTTSSILQLTNASTSLQASLVYEIDKLCDKYDKENGKFKGIKSEKIMEKMSIINSAFQTIHKANTLKAAIYYKEGEYAAVSSVLSEYKRFMEICLTEEKAHILYLADPKAKTFDEIWNFRLNELPEKIDNTKKLLSQPQNFCLEMKKEDLHELEM